ncbi:DNA ligase D [Bacillus sp. HMF5848]|uniref:DNA ligase D n=1 Tax=Bacillus sp. HMF5848 TaxID=2495421 RepID=UPI000F7A9671|nr:DNA ligase D [Bacillus sp. HMF5848]RSK26698.1 DNA ligase D [Bacillus sp. HMF5848]
MKPMLPTLTYEAPKGEDWVYEVKYDGFRAILFWDDTSITLLSRNGTILNNQFPEIIQECSTLTELVKGSLPLQFDGELCILETEYKANFAAIQQRGRLKTEDKIIEASARQRSHFLIFDFLQEAGETLTSSSLETRKNQLIKWFEKHNLLTELDASNNQLLQPIMYYRNFDSLWTLIQQHRGEGVITKRLKSKWEIGKRTTSWVKIKNWQLCRCFIIGYDKHNAYFHVGVIHDQHIIEVGLFSHGLETHERTALLQIIQQNKLEETTKFIKVAPGICVELKYLELYGNQLRQPMFNRFLFNTNWHSLTWTALVHTKIQIPEIVQLTNPEKPLFKETTIIKQEFVQYLMDLSPYMLPFLKNRLLTVIRYPHGTYGERFYQKNCPDYAPDYVQTFKYEEIEYIVCNNIETLAWLGNQLAFEFHVPYETIHTIGSPSEIVLDLDPPSREYFHLAIRAATLLKQVLDGLNLVSFVKTSGNKGLQIYIPLPDNHFTYDDTRLFTELIAKYLITTDPDSFTIERLKKNRGNRLYVDFLQHAEGKTIVAPYSMRGNEGGYVAMPLFWEEVDESLRIEHFPMTKAYERITSVGDPFESFFEVKHTQPFTEVIQHLKQQIKK